MLGEGGVQSHLPHPTGNGQREAQGSWVIPGSAVRRRLKPHQAPFPCLCSTDSFARFRSLWNVAKGRKDRWFQQFWSSPPGCSGCTAPAPAGAESQFSVAPKAWSSKHFAQSKAEGLKLSTSGCSFAPLSPHPPNPTGALPCTAVLLEPVLIIVS